MQGAIETLEQFPPKLEDAYLLTWARIQRQAKSHADLAARALLWVMYVKEEVGIETLRHMIATSTKTYTFEPKNMVPEAVIISACCGLVKVDRTSNRVRLVRECLANC